MGIGNDMDDMDKVFDRVDIVHLLTVVRSLYVFNKDTCYGKYNEAIPSTGHCVMSALYLYEIFDGHVMSSKVNNVSHWFNRIGWGGKIYDIDLTGDQFGFDEIMVRRINDGAGLYGGSVIRDINGLGKSVIDRYSKFRERISTNIVKSP